MGCVVDDHGEAREADLGVSCGNGKGQIFRQGQVLRTVPESKIVDTLLEEALRLTGNDDANDGSVTEADEQGSPDGEEAQS